jgi:hypothetical protein
MDEMLDGLHLLNGLVVNLDVLEVAANKEVVRGGVPVETQDFIVLVEIGSDLLLIEDF